MTLRIVAELRPAPSHATGARADRLALADVALYQHPQQVLRALVERFRRVDSTFIAP